MSAVARTSLQEYGLPLFAKGKVRDIYQLDASKFLFVTTDRISGEADHQKQ